MGLIFKATFGLVVAFVVVNVLRNVLHDAAITRLYQIDRSNTGGKRVFVTGSGRGVGAAVAKEYAKAGAHVALHARSLDALKDVASACRSLGAASVHTVTGDFSRAGAAAKAVNAAAAALGGLDIAIVNHVNPLPFYTVASAVKDLDSGRFETAMRVNFLSYVEASNAALPYLTEANGSLVLISSVAGRLPIPYCYEYCSSKRALAGFFGSLRQEMALNNSLVHVGMATLGLIDTESAKTLVSNHYKSQLSYASLETTAQNVASVALSRTREIVTPWYIRVPLLLSEWAPNHMEKHLQALVKVIE